MAKKIDLGFDVAVQVHAHKSSKLHKTGIDAAQGARIAQRYDPDQVVSNQSIGRLVARRLTSVGLTRASIGPAINVMLRGWAGSESSAMIATAASTATQGWHTPTTCTPGPSTCRKVMTWSINSSKPNSPCRKPTSRALCQSV